MFSVIIPLYNKEQYIERCLDSVLAQSFQCCEIIVVDDGSTDQSLTLVRTYDDSRIKIITQNNQGAGAARNTGILNASRPWVAFLDADDSWTTDHLEELSLLVKSFENVGIVATKSIEINTDLLPDIKVENKQWKRQCVDYFKCAAKISGLIHSSAVAVRRTVFDKVGLFNNFEQGEDTELWSRICLSYPFAASDKPTSIYFRGTGGIMETLWVEKSKEFRLLNSVKEIGPAVSFLVNQLEAGNISKAVSESVIIFINSKITTSLKVDFYNGRIDGLSRIGKFYIKPLSINSHMWKKIADQPRWLLLFLYKTRCIIREIYRSLRK